MNYIIAGTDLFTGVFAILVALYAANYQPMKEAKKQILTRQLINKEAKNRVTNLKTQKAHIGALLLRTKGALAQVLKFKQGLRLQASKLNGMKRRRCGDMEEATYRLKDGDESGTKIVVHNRTGVRYLCESSEKLRREGRISSGGGNSYGGTNSAGR